MSQYCLRHCTKVQQQCLLALLLFGCSTFELPHRWQYKTWLYYRSSSARRSSVHECLLDHSPFSGSQTMVRNVLRSKYLVWHLQQLDSHRFDRRMSVLHCFCSRSATRCPPGQTSKNGGCSGKWEKYNELSTYSTGYALNYTYACDVSRILFDGYLDVGTFCEFESYFVSWLCIYFFFKLLITFFPGSDQAANSASTFTKECIMLRCACSKVL